MLRAVLALGAVVCGTTLASAADLPSRAVPVVAPLPPALTWSGFYVGGHAGAILDNSRVQLLPSGDFAGPAYAPTNAFRSPGINLDETDGTGGVQAGYNLQIGSFVAGIEADIGRGPDRRNTLNAPTSAPLLVGTFTGPVNTKSDLIGTVRGRLGFAFDRFLVFGTGGFAYANTETQTDVMFSTTRDRYIGNFSDTQTGVVYGGGVEYMLTDTISLRGEYLHYDLGRVRSTSQPVFGGAIGNFTYDTRLKTDFDVARAAINFKLNWF
jgi:outer membrane immunogenic protein